MGLEGIMRVQGSASWTAESGLAYARPRSEERQPRPADPSEARTPQEALAYIESLYKSGRMEDLAALLRRNATFRVAWLILQQSSPADFQAVTESNALADRGASQAPANLPVPYLSPPGRSVSPEPGPASLQAAAAGFVPQMSVGAQDSAVEAGLLPVGRQNRLRGAALQAYQSLDRHYALEKELTPRFSLRV